MQIQEKIIVVLFCSIALNACGMGLMMFSIRNDTQYMTKQLENHMMITDSQINYMNTVTQRLSYRLLDIETRTENMPRVLNPAARLSNHTE